MSINADDAKWPWFPSCTTFVQLTAWQSENREQKDQRNRVAKYIRKVVRERPISYPQTTKEEKHDACYKDMWKKEESLRDKRAEERKRREEKEFKLEEQNQHPADELCNTYPVERLDGREMRTETLKEFKKEVTEAVIKGVIPADPFSALMLNMVLVLFESDYLSHIRAAVMVQVVLSHLCAAWTEEQQTIIPGIMFAGSRNQHPLTGKTVTDRKQFFVNRTVLPGPLFAKELRDQQTVFDLLMEFVEPPADPQGRWTVRNEEQIVAFANDVYLPFGNYHDWLFCHKTYNVVYGRRILETARRWADDPKVRSIHDRTVTVMESELQRSYLAMRSAKPTQRAATKIRIIAAAFASHGGPDLLAEAMRVATAFGNAYTPRNNNKRRREVVEKDSHTTEQKRLKEEEGAALRTLVQKVRHYLTCPAKNFIHILGRELQDTVIPFLDEAWKSNDHQHMVSSSWKEKVEETPPCDAPGRTSNKLTNEVEFSFNYGWAPYAFRPGMAHRRPELEEQSPIFGDPTSGFHRDSYFAHHPATRFFEDLAHHWFTIERSVHGGKECREWTEKERAQIRALKAQSQHMQPAPENIDVYDSRNFFDLRARGWDGGPMVRGAEVARWRVAEKLICGLTGHKDWDEWHKWYSDRPAREAEDRARQAARRAEEEAKAPQRVRDAALSAAADSVKKAKDAARHVEERNKSILWTPLPAERAHAAATVAAAVAAYEKAKVVHTQETAAAAAAAAAAAKTAQATCA